MKSRVLIALCVVCLITLLVTTMRKPPLVGPRAAARVEPQEKSAPLANPVPKTDEKVSVARPNLILQSTPLPNATPQAMPGWSGVVAPDRETMMRGLREKWRINTDAMYDEFYTRAQLTFEQRNRFGDIDIARREEQDALFKGLSAREKPTDPPRHELMLDVIKENGRSDQQQAILDEFGPAVFETYIQFESERAIGNLTKGFATMLATTSEPVDREQLSKIARALSSATIDSRGHLDFSSLDLAKTFSAAGDFMSPGQVETLRHVVETHIARTKK